MCFCLFVLGLRPRDKRGSYVPVYNICTVDARAAEDFFNIFILCTIVARAAEDFLYYRYMYYRYMNNSYYE